MHKAKGRMIRVNARVRKECARRRRDSVANGTFSPF
jgi:hypothetical protein